MLESLLSTRIPVKRYIFDDTIIFLFFEMLFVCSGLRRDEDKCLNLGQHQGSAIGDIDLDVLIATSPVPGGGEVPALVADASVTSKAFLIRVEQDLVLTRLRNGNTVVGKGLCRVEVENEDGSCTIKGQDLVTLVLQRNKSLEVKKQRGFD